jgi:hypothetical protein
LEASIRPKGAMPFKKHREVVIISPILYFYRAVVYPRLNGMPSNIVFDKGIALMTAERVWLSRGN